MDIQLSDHFTYKRLLRFTIPAMGMMLVTSVYSVVDGLFVSNIVGKTAFAALNLMWPVIGLFGAVGLMIGSGGSALVAKMLGEGKDEKARQIFTMLVAGLLLFSVALAVVGVCITPWIAERMGAEDALLGFCITYGRILFALIPAYILQMAFQTLLVTAEKPQMGFFLSIGAGVTNMLLDFVFIYVFPFGLAGAAAATAMGWMVGGIIPLIYFFRNKRGILRFTRFAWDWRAMGQACSNGISEMITNLSFSFLSILYNYQLMRILGENGVAAYGIIMYVAFIFAGVFIGYSMGVAPVIAYHYGAQNNRELQNLFKKSNVLIGLFAAVLTLLSEVTAPALASFFVGYDAQLEALAIFSLRLYSICFLLCGFNMFASAMFTALNNGWISGLIACIRLGCFEATCVILLPLIFGINGIWFATTTAETLAIIMNIFVYKAYNKRYHYLPEMGEKK